MSALRTIFRYWLWLFLALIVVQIAFAGFGAFDTVDNAAAGPVDENSVDDSWGLHIGFGYLVLLGSLLTLILALIARVGRQRVLQAVGIFVLVIVQVLLAWFGSEVPAIGALHPVNAFLIVGAAGALTVREWRGERMTSAAAAPAAPPPSAAA